MPIIIPEGMPEPSDEERIEMMMRDLGMTRSYARFVLAMEKGEIGPEGDLVTLDDGSEASRPAPSEPGGEGSEDAGP